MYTAKIISVFTGTLIHEFSYDEWGYVFTTGNQESIWFKKGGIQIMNIGTANVIVEMNGGLAK